MDERGQTTLDFAIGVSVFLLTVAFVFSFVPGMVQPFANSGQEEMAASNRLADRLATDTLTNEEPYVLDDSCTEAFFDEDDPAPTGCSFDGGAVEDVLAIDSRMNVHVSLTGDFDGNGSDSSYDVGESLPSSGSVVTASRRVSIGGTYAELVVNVW